MDLRKYITNISSLQFYQLLRFGTLILISIVFAKSNNFGTADIGSYESFLLVSGAVSFFWVDGIIQSFLPLYKSNNSLRRSDIHESQPVIFNSAFMLLILSLGMAALVFFFHKPLSALINDGKPISHIELLVIYIILNNPSFLIEYIYIVKNKSISLIKYGIFSFALHFIFVASPAFLGYGLYYCFIGLLAISFLRFTWLIYLILNTSSFSFSIKYMKEHLIYAWPLMTSLLLSRSIEYISGIIILKFYNPEAFAVFKYGARELPFVFLLANAFSNAMIPEFAEADNTEKAFNKLKNKSLNLMNVLFPLTIGFLLISNWAFPLIFNSNFTQSADIFNIFLLMTISRLVFPHTILIGKKDTKSVMFASFIELLINLFLCFIFIKPLGIIGIAVALVFGNFSQKLYWIIILYKKYKIKPQDYIPLNTFALYSFSILLIFSLKYFT